MLMISTVWATEATLPLEALLVGAPPTATDATVRACTEAALTVDELENGLDKAEQALVRLDTTAVERTLADLEYRLPCLDAPPSRSQLARIPYLRGVTRFNEGDKRGAGESFEAALAVHPDMQWDPTYPPDALPLFERSRPETSGSLLVVPSPAPGTLWVDGRQVADPSSPLPLAPGAHLVQLAGPVWVTVVLETRPQPARLTFPSELARVLDLDDPSQVTAAQGALGAALPPGTPITLVDDQGRVLTGSAGSALSPPEEERDVAKGLRRSGILLMTSAGALGVAGGVAFLDASRSMAAAETYGQALGAAATGTTAANQLVAAQALAGAGATSWFVGWLMDRREAP